MASEKFRNVRFRELVNKIEEEEQYLRSRLPSDVDRPNGALVGLGALGIGALLTPVTGGLSIVVGALGAKVGHTIHQNNATDIDVCLQNERIAQSALLVISEIKSLLVQDKFEIALHEWNKYQSPTFKTWYRGNRYTYIRNEK